MMRILGAGAHKRMPWKNGKGETVEIAIFPPDASLDSFEWRVSMATVAADGPFSLFDGIDRTLCVLSGEGMRLMTDNADAVELRPGSPPHCFPADLPTQAQLLGAPITDLNVMSRRGRFTHSVVPLAAGMSFPPANSERLLLCSRGRLQLLIHGRAIEMDSLDCAALDPLEGIELGGDGAGFLISFHRT